MSKAKAIAKISDTPQKNLYTR